MIPTLVPSGRGELEITDVNNHYIAQGTMAYDVLEGFWGDAGESIDAYYAVNDFVRPPRRQQGLTGPATPRRPGDRSPTGVRRSGTPSHSAVSLRWRA